MKPKIAILWSLILLLFTVPAKATFEGYHDSSDTSPSGRYRIEAKSPGNKDRKAGQIRLSQSNFVITCFDNQEKKLLWTHRQGTEADQQLSKAERASKIANGEVPPITYSTPIGVFAADSGWTAVRTRHDELICIDRAGVVQPGIDILKDALTPEEHEHRVRPSSVGPLWSEFSLWYFVEVDGVQLYIIRPWWGRRILIDVANSRLTKETEAILKIALPYEKVHVLNILKRGVSSPKDADHVWYFNTSFGAFLAGSLQITDAIPILRELEKSDYRGGTVGAGYTDPNDAINPSTFDHEIYPLRQLAQLSLRRLGQTPTPYPAYAFEIYKNGEAEYFLPSIPKIARHTQTDKIEKGMGTKAVLTLIGSPDFVDEEWHYDMDAEKPYTLVLTWENARLVKIERVSPPIWKSGLTRDQGLLN